MKRYALREQMNGIPEPPGKVWFWELEAGVIDADRCIQCGTCVAVCPSNSIGIDEDTDLPELVKMCTGCSLCWDFCPRGGLRYEALWPPSTLDEDRGRVVPIEVKADAADTYWKITGGPPAEGLGAVLERYAVRSSARSEDVQDGGAVTAILTGLLAAGEIDGALVSKPSSDPDEPWKGVATIATDAGRAGRRLGELLQPDHGPGRARPLALRPRSARPRLAVVGTPCEIEGIRAMQSRRWPTGAHRVDAVVLTIALLCTKSFDYEGLILRELARQARRRPRPGLARST